MGLGKTLVILSTVAGSLDKATEFVKHTQTEQGERTRVPSKATLVIAPSSREIASYFLSLDHDEYRKLTAEDHKVLMDSWVDEIRE